MTITVYSKPDCVQCDRTKFLMDREGIERTTIDVTQDAESLAYIKGLGYLSAPVVVIKDDNGEVTNHWYGFRPDLINQI